MSAKLIFLGSPSLVTPILQELINSPHQITAVITQPDKPTGRGQKLTPTPIKQLAQANNMQVLTPHKLDDQFQQQLPDQRPDIAILAAYGKIIPQWLLDYPTNGIINLHPSKLPLARGAMPTLPPILRGETQTAMSIMQMDAELDHGPIIAQIPFQIKEEESSLQLAGRMFSESASFLPEIINQYLISNNQQLTTKDYTIHLPPQEQNHSQATFTTLLKKQDVYITPQLLQSAINNQPAELDLFPKKIQPIIQDIYQPNLAGIFLYRLIQALHDMYTPWTELIVNQQPTRTKLLEAQFTNNQFQLLTTQLPGKNPTSWSQLQQAYQVDLYS